MMSLRLLPFYFSSISQALFQDAVELTASMKRVVVAFWIQSEAFAEEIFTLYRKFF